MKGVEGDDIAEALDCAEALAGGAAGGDAVLKGAADIADAGPVVDSEDIEACVARFNRADEEVSGGGVKQDIARELGYNDAYVAAFALVEAHGLGGGGGGAAGLSDGASIRNGDRFLQVRQGVISSE
jgi:hypothetical protein